VTEFEAVTALDAISDLQHILVVASAGAVAAVECDVAILAALLELCLSRRARVALAQLKAVTALDALSNFQHLLVMASAGAVAAVKVDIVIPVAIHTTPLGL
jgi:hypothetical protein